MNDAISIQEQLLAKQAVINPNLSPAEMDRIVSTHNFKILSVMSAAREDIEFIKQDLTWVELETAGNMFFNSYDYAAAIEYLGLAIAKADRRTTNAGLYREIANVYYFPGPTQNISKGREYFLKSLSILIDGKKSGYTPQAYFVQNASELAEKEAYFGNPDCASKLLDQISSFGLKYHRDAFVSQNVSIVMQRSASWPLAYRSIEHECEIKLPDL